MLRYSIILIPLIFCFCISSAQRLMNKGDAAMELYHYNEAISNFESLLSKRNVKQDTKAEANFKIGYCYLKLSLTEKSLKYFESAISYNYENPKVHYYYGQALQMNQQYYEALIQYEKYKDFIPESSLAEKAIESIHYSFKMIEDPTRYEVNIVARLSSPETDYSPFFEQRNYRKVYFTSTRFSDIHCDQNLESGDNCSNIFSSEMDRNNRWSIPEPIQGQVNTSSEEGAASLNFRSSNLYFTRCSYSRKQDLGCRIYVAKKTGSTWGRVSEIEIPGIPSSVSIGHPAISDDELELYFSAEGLPGSLGGKDIYVVSREKKHQNFGYPRNLGPTINTTGDEMYPYIRRNGELYFSSNGHAGMGGLDIFKAVKNSGSYEVTNMGSPINSSHDDFGIVFMGNREEGFISSRRFRGMGKTDIFHFVLPEMQLTVSGTIFDNMSMEKINNTEIQVLNEEMILLETHYSDSHGRYNISLEPEMKYIILFFAETYKKELIELDTKNMSDSKDFRRDVFFNK